MALVVINAGHAPEGNPDPGAVGLNGLRESDVTKAVADKAAAYLEAVLIKTIVVQDDDLDAVCAVANDNNADLFVSIHCNASDNREATGMEIFTSRGETRADRLATFIMNQLSGDFPILPVRSDWSDGDIDKEAGLYVLNNTDAPAVLVELAFISNPNEEILLGDTMQQYKFAAAIARGCTDFFC